MRELIVKMSMSMDGFVSDPAGENAWMFGDDEKALAWSVDLVASAGLHIMGSASFRTMAGFYPTSTIPFAPAMNDIPKAVFSRQGEAILTRDGERYSGNWSDAYVVSGDLSEEIAALKSRGGGPIIAHAGATFVSSLVAARLFDQLVLLVHPTAIGHGLSIFEKLSAPLSLKLDSSIAFPGGAVAQTYRRA